MIIEVLDGLGATGDVGNAAVKPRLRSALSNCLPLQFLGESAQSRQACADPNTACTQNGRDPSSSSSTPERRGTPSPPGSTAWRCTPPTAICPHSPDEAAILNALIPILV